MLSASSEIGINLVMEVSSIVNSNKRKVDALEQVTIRDLRLLEHVMKVVERIVELLFRENVHVGFAMAC